MLQGLFLELKAKAQKVVKSSSIGYCIALQNEER